MKDDRPVEEKEGKAESRSVSEVGRSGAAPSLPSHRSCLRCAFCCMTVYIFVDAHSLANFIDDDHNVLCATHSESLMLSRKR